MSTPTARSPARLGFTLVEVMISVALVLIVILGVNQVFALTSQAVGTGQAMGTIARDARQVQAVLYRDLSNAEVTRAPFFLINSESYAAFRNRADQLADLDYDVTSTNLVTTDAAVRSLDRDGNGTEDPNERTSRAFMTSRTHRADQLIFFTRTKARRQTGNANTFTSGVTSNEQYVSYGHLRQPDSDLSEAAGPMPMPGIVPSEASSVTAGPQKPTDNPNNFYANQWVLGRSVLLMREPEAVGNQQFIYDRSGATPVPVTYYGRRTTATSPRQFWPLQELSGLGSTLDGTTATGSPAEVVQRSYYDLVGIGMDRFRDEVMGTAIAGSTANGEVWHNKLVFRFRGFPTPNKPLSSRGVARTVPCILNHCTQFAVEFAGDFLTQDATTGAVTNFCKPDGTGTDGETDFIVSTYTLNGVPQTSRRIRWYGFPRDTSGALGAAGVTDVANAGKPDGFVYAQDDVVPLRDLINTTVAFEKFVPDLPPVNPTTGTPRVGQRDYGYSAGSPEPLSINRTATNTNGSPKYRCVWSPADSTVANLPRPRMLRVTIAIDDPAGRVGSEQYFEYVADLPQ